MMREAKPTIEFIKGLDETVAICKAATEGPWGITGGELDIEPEGLIIESDVADSNVAGVFGDKPANANFIVHARTKLPEACAAFREVCEKLLYMKQVFSDNAELAPTEEAHDAHEADGVILDALLRDLGIEPGDDDGK